MKGNNAMEINEATMIEAIQYWLRSVMTGEPPKVTSVSMEGSGVAPKTFRIELLTPDEKTKA